MSHRNRDRDPRDERDYRGSRGARDAGRDSLREPQNSSSTSRPSGTSSKSSRAALNEYWIDGEGILREVLQKQICKMLGPEALCRPSVYNGVSGFCVTAVRPFTPDQLDDLIEISSDYLKENRAIQQKGQQAISYGESQTSRRHDGGMSSIPGPGPGPGHGDSYGEDYRASRAQTTYSMASSQRGYAAPANFPAPSQGGYPESVYAPPHGSAYPPASAYSSQGFPAVSRPRTNESDNYIYERDDFQGPVDSYRQPSNYLQGTREPIRVDREPRYMDRDPRDMRDPNRDLRDTRDPRDSRIDPRDRRGESRPMPSGYPSYVVSPGDVRMADADDDRYGYADAALPSQNSRGFQSSSRPVPSGYNPRGSPGLREYRPEPMREERRRR